jgi:hypothetical protein
VTDIDRRSVVERHDVVLTAPDATAPLSVGNGDFARTVDITGMQTYTAFYDPALAGDRSVINTCTQTSWGWHEMPNPHGYTQADTITEYRTAGGDVPYPDRFDMRAMLGQEVAPDMAPGTWLHVNPQRLDLGRTGLVLRPRAGAAPDEDPLALTNVHQRMHLWSGTVRSTFDYVGQPVSVTTAAHPELAQVAFRIESNPATAASWRPLRSWWAAGTVLTVRSRAFQKTGRGSWRTRASRPGRNTRGFAFAATPAR